MTGSPSRSTVLIAGASRGLGLGLAKAYLDQGWQVIGTVRGTRHTLLHDLVAASGGRLEIEPLDINDADQIAALRHRLAGRSITLLFVNAGIANDPAETIGAVTTETFVNLMVTNALSPLRVIEALESLVPPSGTIAAMSSGLGSVANNTFGGFEAYRASKAALNTLMRSFAARHAKDPRSLLLIAPGWVRTDMGGPQADLSVEESVAGMVATIARQSGQSGLRYLNHDGQTLPW